MFSLYLYIRDQMDTVGPGAILFLKIALILM
jgi:hypothetical protein